MNRKQETDGREGEAGRRPFRRERAKPSRWESPKTPMLRKSNLMEEKRVKGLSGEAGAFQINLEGGRA